MKLDESKLFFAPISGLKLRPIMESWVSGEKESVVLTEGLSEKEMKEKVGTAIMTSLIKWKDKDKAEKLFFEHTSLEGYGKLSESEVQEKILKDFGILSLTTIFGFCWIEYLGKSLAGTGDQEG